MAHAAISENTEILFLGTSLVRTDITPDCFDRKIINLPINGANYQVAELLLQYNLNRMPNLKLVVLEIDNLMLFYDRFASFDFISLYEQGVPISAIPTLTTLEAIYQHFMCNFLLQPFFYNDRLSPRGLVYRSKMSMSPPRPGSQALDFSMTDKELAKRDLNQDEGLLHLNTRKDNCASLFRILDAMTGKKIAVVLLRYPQISKYAEVKSEAWNTTYQELLSTVLNHYGDNITYWDYMTADDIDLDDFSDTRHLNTSGATTFSKIIADRIENDLFSKN